MGEVDQTQTEQMYDAIIHAKSKDSGPSAAAEKKEFPITRFSNVLGAPHMVDLVTVKDAHPDEYLLLETGEMYLTDAEFGACFGDIVTT